MAVSDKPWGNITQADYTPEQWARACLIDTGEGEPVSKNRYKLPVKEPSGAINRAACHTAAGALAGARTPLAATPEQKKAAARKLVSIYRNDLDEDPPDSLLSLAGMSARTDVEVLPTRSCDRAFVLDDLHVRSDGSGRVVEAYAAAFNVRTEVMDQDGHYFEELPPTSFDRTIQHKGVNFGVLFNHGRTIDGEPNPAATMPIGVPLEVRADERGVFTATRYLDNPLADHVLDAIKAGAIKAQSFSGRFTKSAKSYPGGRGRGQLPLITRHEVDMREYGPAVFAAYKEAAILGTRAEQFIRALLETPPDRRLAWLEQFEGLTTPLLADPEALILGTPSGPAELVEDPPELVARHSARPSLRSRVKAARITRGWE